MTFEWIDVIQADPFDPRGTENSSRATISNIYTDGTVDLSYKGGTAARVPVSSAYAPRTGDVVEVIRRNMSSLLVLGPVRTSNQTTVDVDSGLSLMYNVEPALAPVDTTPNPLVVNPTSTKSFRGGDWERDDVYQGAAAPQYGYWRGCYFYGTTPQQLAGRRCTRLRIRISRKGEGGVISNVAQYLLGHVHESQPSSSPLFTTHAHLAGHATRNQPIDLDLPVEWGQALMDGQLKGFGHLRDTTGDYSIAYSKAGDAATGRLTIDWA